MTMPDFFIIGQDYFLKAIVKCFVARERRKKLKQYIVLKNTKAGSVEPAGLEPEIKKRLVEEYREAILKLQGLLDRDLSAWLCG